MRSLLRLNLVRMGSLHMVVMVPLLHLHLVPALLNLKGQELIRLGTRTEATTPLEGDE